MDNRPREDFSQMMKCSEETKLRLQVIAKEYVGEYSVKEAARILKMSEEVYCQMRDDALQGMLAALQDKTDTGGVE